MAISEAQTRSQLIDQQIARSGCQIARIYGLLTTFNPPSPRPRHTVVGLIINPRAHSSRTTPNMPRKNSASGAVLLQDQAAIQGHSSTQDHRLAIRHVVARRGSGWSDQEYSKISHLTRM